MFCICEAVSAQSPAGNLVTNITSLKAAINFANTTTLWAANTVEVSGIIRPLRVTEIVHSTDEMVSRLLKSG